MKRNTLIIVCFSLLALAGCGKKFLDRTPDGTFAVENYYKTKRDLLGATAPLYGVQNWFGFSSSFMRDMGELYGGNFFYGNATAEALMRTSDGGGNQTCWVSLYKVIGQCGLTIANIQTLSPATLPDVDKNDAIAEAKFIRATAYFYLVRLYGSVPILENPALLVNTPQIPRYKIEDVYQYIINDLNFAVKNLAPVEPAGRVNKWSAEGMLAKVYLTRSGLNQSGTRLQSDLDSAKKYAGDVCLNSGISLMSSYYDLFLRKNNKNPEGLFALQWNVTPNNWGYQNYYQAGHAESNDISGVGDGWGTNGVTEDLFRLYTQKDSIRRKATFMQNGDFYPELADNGWLHSGTGTAVKKYVIGTAAKNDGKVVRMQTDIQTYVLRLADVYLIYAEAILGNNAATSDPMALTYFNKVRSRAIANPNPLPTSLTLDSIYKERRIEMAGENDYIFDLYRLHYWNPTKADAMITAQKRGAFTYDNNTGIITPDTNQQLTLTPTATSYIWPYPSVEVSSNPLLTQPPQPYKF